MREHCAKTGAVAPEMPDLEPFDAAAPDSLSIDRLGAVIFACGFRPEYSSWIRVPGAFDAMGFPLEDDGTSVATPGLYLCGVPFMRKRKSSLLIGVGEDAVIVAKAVAHRPVVV